MEKIYHSPFGPLLLGFSEGALTSLRISRDIQPQCESAQAGGEILEWLEAYFKGENPPADALNLKAAGTAFQERVWKSLRAIPYGYCVTYGFLARMIAPQTKKRRLLARAVGGALAANPIWIIIPCHRVIRSDGSLGKYAGGAEMKRALLRLEGCDLKESLLKPGA